MVSWGWPSELDPEFHEGDNVGAEGPLPRWKFWRRPPKPLEPQPCARCGTDCRAFHVYVGGRDKGSQFCLACCAGATEALE